MPEFLELCEPRPFTVDEQEAIDGVKRLFATRKDILFQSDDYFLTKFLRFCDWNPEKAFACIVGFYELKHLNPQHYAQKNVSEYMDILSANSRVLLDKRDKEGRVVFVGKLGKKTVAVGHQVLLTKILFLQETSRRTCNSLTQQLSMICGLNYF